jgi:GlpG protein
MRLLSEHADRREAQRLADHLLVASIDTHVRASERWEVWVRDDDDLARAQHLLAAFRAGTIEGDTARRAKEIRAEQAAAEYGWGQRFFMARNRWRGADAVPMQPLTTAMIVVSVIVAFITRLGEPSPVLMFFTMGPNVSWRVLTPMFLHFGILHLLFNMMWLRSLGGQIEHRHGTLVMIAVVVVSQAVGSFAQYWYSGPLFGGMSGVNYGLFAFAWMYSRFDRRRGYQLDDGNVVLMMLWFVACATGWLGPIANFGHAGGLVAGLVLGALPWLRHLRGRASELPDTPGSWADVHLVGWRRFRRKWLAPYMPLWFLALAGVVIAMELV